MSKQELCDVSLSAPCGADQEHIALGRKLARWDVVEVDATDTLDVSVGHERQGSSGFVLCDISMTSQLIEDLIRAHVWEIFDKVEKILVLVVSVRICRDFLDGVAQLVERQRVGDRRWCCWGFATLAQGLRSFLWVLC